MYHIVNFPYRSSNGFLPSITVVELGESESYKNAYYELMRVWVPCKLKCKFISLSDSYNSMKSRGPYSFHTPSKSALSERYELSIVHGRYLLWRWTVNFKNGFTVFGTMLFWKPCVDISLEFSVPPLAFSSAP